MAHISLFCQRKHVLNPEIVAMLKLIASQEISKQTKIFLELGTILHQSDNPGFIMV